MVKKDKEKEQRKAQKDELDKLQVLSSHYQAWTNDNDIRRTREDGWNDITDAYWGKLPEKWPYDSRIVDPRIRTSIIDKDARLINARLRGRLVPREGGDILGARINNAVLDFQWDNAQWGGSMESKLLTTSQDTRLYASKFARIPWMVRKDGDVVTFEGNEYEPLDIRDCGLDYACKSIKDAKWFQLREWQYLEDLLEHNQSSSPEAKFLNLDKISGEIRDKKSMRGGGDRRDRRYQSRVKQLKGLQDRLGQDMAFPIVELVTEYRSDRWVTFAPAHGVILRDIPNPYAHRKIPIVQLRYYSLQDDPMGESEVEPVLSIWRGIQACVCGFFDEVNIKMRPPIKIVEGGARIETIVYQAEAQWLVTRQDAVEEMRSDSSGIINYFQSTYQSLVSAFNTAMGDLSQGTSNADPFTRGEKTATEVKQVAKQQNVRDERNQLILSQFIQDIMAMWLSNNQQFLFSDPAKHDIVLRIVGSEQFEYFKRSGLDQMEVSDEKMQEIGEIISLQEGNVSDQDIQTMLEAALEPKFPVKRDGKIVSKMEVSEMGDSAELTIVPEDLNGTYDYIPDVKSMASGADAELQNARLRALEYSTNPAMVQQLMAEGYKPKIKELMVSVFEDLGNKDAERFFEKVESQPQMAEQVGPDGMPVPTPNVDISGGYGMTEAMNGQTPQSGAMMPQ